MPPSLSSAFPCAYWLHLSAGSSFVVTRGPMINDRASQSKSRSAPPLSSAPWGRMLVVTEANLGELCPRSRGCWCAEVEADQRTPERQGLDTEAGARPPTLDTATDLGTMSFDLPV